MLVSGLVGHRTQKEPTLVYRNNLADGSGGKEPARNDRVVVYLYKPGPTGIIKH